MMCFGIIYCVFILVGVYWGHGSVGFTFQHIWKLVSFGHSSNIFGDILQIPFGKRHNYKNVAVFASSIVTTPPPGFPAFLFTLIQSWKKLLKTGSILDSIFSRVGTVQGKFRTGSAAFFVDALPHRLFHRLRGGSRGRKGYSVFTISLKIVFYVENTGSWKRQECWLYLGQLTQIF